MRKDRLYAILEHDIEYENIRDLNKTVSKIRRYMLRRLPYPISDDIIRCREIVKSFCRNKQ